MMTPPIAALSCLLLCAAMLPAQAREWRPWCDPGSSPGQAPGADPALGWHFYCDPDREQAPPRAGASPETAASPPAAPDSATDRILEMRRALEESRAAAILDPSPEKVAAYLQLQQAALQRAAAFSDSFRRTVWARPDLDYTLKRPVGALAKRLWSDQRRAEREAALATLSERYGLIYLGHAGLRRLPGVRPAAARLRVAPWPGRARGLDDRRGARRLARGGARQRPRRPARAGGHAGARRGPLRPETQRVLPVGFGVIAEDQLAERIFALTALEPGHDY